MHKKLFVLILALYLAIGMAACSDNNLSSGAPSKTTVKASTVTTITRRPSRSKKKTTKTYLTTMKTRPSSSKTKTTTTHLTTVTTHPSVSKTATTKKTTTTPTAENTTTTIEETTTTAEETTTTEEITTTTEYVYKMPIMRIADVQQLVYVDPVRNRYVRYCLILPENFDEDRSYPVILYLHGAGERGFDNAKQLLNMTYSLYTDMIDYFDEAIFVAPQCSSTGWWSLDTDQNGVHRGELGAAMRLFEHIVDSYNVDTSRLYVMGLSMGGYATWEVLTHFPDTFAAGIPICGWSNTAYAATLKDIPIWAYHGKRDTTVSYQGSQEMVDAIRAIGGNKIHLTLNEDAGHGVWSYAARDRDLFAWLFAQQKDM